jgi:hypothetical protein
MNYNSKAREETMPTPYQHHDKGSHCKIGWTVMPQPPYSPDLTPSYIHLFGPVKNGLHGGHFHNDDAVIAALKNWLRKTDSICYRKGIQVLAQQWRKWIVP